jgi:TonB family protein
MASLTKETLEVSKSTGGSAVTTGENPSKQSSGHMRSDAVSLEIPVKVHGSRVAEVVRDVTPHTEPFEEQTTTMIVFPQGAVVRMTTSVTVGQMLVITNSKTRQDAICRVVKVRTFSKMQGYVEIEFTHSQPGYWGVHFPGDGPVVKAASPASAPAAVPEPAPAPPVSKAEQPKTESAPEVSWAPARVTPPPAAPPAAPNKLESKPLPPPPPVAARPTSKESAFISIGSKETVEPAAALTSHTPAATRLPAEKEAPQKTAAHDFPAAPPSKPVPSLTMEELLGDELATLPAAASENVKAEETSEEKIFASAEHATSSARNVFGSFTGGASLTGSHSAPSEEFGTHLDLDLQASSNSEPAGKNWLLVAACIALVFAGTVAGIVYVRQHLGGHAPATVASQTTPPAPAPQTSVPLVPAASVTQQQAPPVTPQRNFAAKSPASATVAPFEGTKITVAPNSPAAGAPPASAGNQPTTPEKQAAAGVTSDMVAATLNAHPISAQRADSSSPESAPVLDPTAGGADGAAPAISTSADVPALTAPEMTPAGPVRVGGEVKEPRLRYFKQPDYPAVAKQAHVTGDVVIDTQIDKAGNVAHMKVVSGPPLLRQSALDALHAWKYEPSTLDGQPVAIQMLVTIKFRF